MKVCIERFKHSDKQTLGNLYAYDDAGALLLHLKTLELPWKENQRRVSCIPVGSYTAIGHVSPKFGKCFWVQDVPGRSEILFHAGNYYTDILGCILVGVSHSDINGDGLLDVTSSRDAMKMLLDVLPGKFDFEITNVS